MRQQYINEYTDSNILAFYKIASSKCNFKNVYVDGGNVEDNYLLDENRRKHIYNLYQKNDISNESFHSVLNMLSDDELIYIGF